MIPGISLLILIIIFGWTALKLTETIIDKIKNDVEDY